MTYWTELRILLFAAVLEAGGDRLMRVAMKGMSGSPLIWRLVVGAVAGLVLSWYGYTVNTPDWDFGRLLGTYVVFFFLVAQVLSWKMPSPALLLGGTLIIVGGIIISRAR